MVNKNNNLCPNCGSIPGFGNKICMNCGCPLTGEIQLNNF